MNRIYDILVVILLKITIALAGDDVERFFSAKSTLEGYYTEEQLEEHQQHLQVGQDPDFDDFPDKAHKENGKYPCLRHCDHDSKPELCYYKFKIIRSQTFSRKCDFSSFTRKKYFDDGCITADGTKMRMLTVNEMVPGTAIHVCQGDTVVVDVENLLPGGRSVSIHWHGIKQPNSQWIDGVSFLTQCPIGSRQKFRYEFKALEAGTFFYHASDNEQHVGGLTGPLIVRSKENVAEYDLYDEDLYSHTIFIQDLVHEKDDLKFPFTDARGRFLSPSSYLINGRGQYKEKTRLGFSKHTDSPFAEFLVERQKDYRFRIVAATNSSCSFRLAIEKHAMAVIAADGHPVTPVNVGTIHMHAGERVDVVVRTLAKTSPYWIRVQGNDFCSSARQSAILLYKDSHKKIPSSKSSKKIFAQFSKNWPDLNNLGLGCSNTSKNLCWENLQSANIVPEKPENTRVKLRKIKAARIRVVDPNVAQSPVSKEKFNLAYGEDYLEETETFDEISCLLPPLAMLKQFYEPMPEAMNCKRVKSLLKKCFNVIDLKLDEVIDIMFMDATNIDLSEAQKKIRPTLLSYDRSIHFHGHSVRILKQGTLQDFQERGQDPHFPIQTLATRIFKDTISIPKDGYTIVRLYASNPGIWALKTPVTDGNNEGVALVLRVGGENFVESGINVPFRFPTCNNFLPPVKHLTELTEGKNKEKIENESPRGDLDNIEAAGRGDHVGSSSGIKYSEDSSTVENVAEELPLEDTVVKVDNLPPINIKLPPRLQPVTVSLAKEREKSPTKLMNPDKSPKFTDGEKSPSQFTDGGKSPTKFADGGKSPTKFADGGKSPSKFADGEKSQFTFK